MENNKIALITYSLSSGGLERVVANSSFMFSSLGYEVHIFVINSSVDYQYKAILHCYNLDKLSVNDKVKAYQSLKKDIQSHQFKLIIDHRYRLNKFTEFYWQKCIYANQNVLLYVHSSNIYSYLFQSNYFNQILFKNRKFICVSEGIETIINKNHPSLQTQTIYNVIDINSNKISIDIKGEYIVTIGRMDRSNVKQIDVLLKCYAKSLLPKNDVKLCIIGDGVRLTEMQQLAKELKIEDLVIFKGFLDKPFVYLKNALFTVLASKYEGLPTVLIESLFVDTPVISFDCETGPNEIIVNNVNGVLVENQNKKEFINALNKLYSDKVFYNNIKAEIKNTINKFESTTILNKWNKILNDIN